ncbi:MAG: hypothetical protein M3O30_08345 [Planctomycetota bacterium]|nr:hypothetical protein [Planctomycetota bacterium]
MMNLTRPSIELAKRRLKEFDADPNLSGGDAAVRLVFDHWPKNTNFNEVLAKVVILDRLYSTNVFYIYKVASHILQKNIDDRLSCGDLSTVADLAKTEFTGKPLNLLSFASKYCAWHQPNQFQIFDNLVESLLWEYQKAYAFGKFERTELRIYLRYIEILKDFCGFFGLDELCRKDVDKFLWMEGRELQNSRQSSSKIEVRNADPADQPLP